MTSDPNRPLSDAQERALIRLARDPERFHYKICRAETTLDVLERQGLVETRLWHYSLDREARITAKGLALLATMGDQR
jgi:hypothetical protein